jgi:hypothetical protein
MRVIQTHMHIDESEENRDTSIDSMYTVVYMRIHPS